jgi:drug/metabolite transporter (DMT)-like permease
MIQRFWPYLVLILLGAGWGASIPLTKIAVSTGHQEFGLIFWQLAIMSVLLSVVVVLRGKPVQIGLPSIRLFAIVALVGTVLPNTASYTAAVHLPAAFMAILIATVAMWAFPIAIAMGQDRFSWKRLSGLIIGLIAVVLLVAPSASFPDRSVLWFVPIALIAPFFYGIEGNYISKFGTLHHGPIETLLGASVVGWVIVTPAAIVTGQVFNPLANFGAAELALLATSLIHAIVYTSYVWLVGRVGSVFAAQVSYMVTIFGVCWSILFLGEEQSRYLWASLVCMMAGMSLVQTRSKDT